MPTMRMVSGIQNHTTPTAAPVIIDAEGTRPMVPPAYDVGDRFDRPEQREMYAGVSGHCNHAYNLGSATASRYGVFPRPQWGITPASPSGPMSFPAAAGLPGTSQP